MAARAAGSKPQWAVPGCGRAAAPPVRRAPAAADARGARRPNRGAFYEEDDRILGHAAAPYHRIDIRHTSRHLVVRSGDRVVADTTSPLVLYESGFAPRWYVPRDDVAAETLTPVDAQTFCP